MDQNFSKEYLRRYQEIVCLIERAYADVFLLQELDRYNMVVQKTPEKIINTNAHNLLGHICEITKADFGLTIWKLFSDNDSKANTVRHLNSYIRKNARKDLFNSVELVKISEAGKRTANKLNDLRSTFLAHNDREKFGVSIKIEDLLSLLDELRRYVNSLCLKELNGSVCAISDLSIFSIQFQVRTGWMQIIDKALDA